MFKFWLQQKATDGATEVDFQEKALEGSRSKINLRHIRCTPTAPSSRPQPWAHLTLKRTCNVVINELINEWPRKGRIEPSKSKLITSRSRNQRLIANRTEDEIHWNCYMHKFYLHFYIIFLLLTKPQANTWPQKPDIISFYGIRVEFVPQQQQSKHVCHNHMWRLTDFPITNVCTWLWTSVSVCVCGVYLHTQKSICIGSRFVFVFVVALSIFGFCITTCDFLRFLHCDCQKQWQTVSAKLRFTSNEVGPIRFCTLCGCAILGSWFDFSFNFNSLFFFSDWQCILMNWIENSKDSGNSKPETYFLYQ